MPTLSGPLGIGHSIPIMGSSYDRNQTTKRITNLSIQRLEATFDSFATVAIAPESKIHDHLLLTVHTVVNGTPLCALVDSGTNRSFIDEKLQFCPPLTFIGAYSSLEMVNGETLVSTRVTQYVLVSINKIQFRSCQTTLVVDVLGCLVYCKITPSLFFICQDDCP